MIYRERITSITDSQTEFKHTMLNSNLCDYSDVYMLIKSLRLIKAYIPAMLGREQP